MAQRRYRDLVLGRRTWPGSIAPTRCPTRRWPGGWSEGPDGRYVAGTFTAPALCGLLGWALPQVLALAEALAARGLAHIELGRTYLRFHPALAAVLEAELRAGQPPEAVAAAWGRTVQVYRGMASGLNGMRGGEQGQVAIGLAVRELLNLLRALNHLADAAGEAPTAIDAAIGCATALEGLLR